MITKQISVFLENQAGKLAAVASCLSDANIDLRAISLAEAADFGIVRIIVDDVLEAVSVLRNNNYICSVTDVITVEIQDKPGALCDIITALGEADINLEYMYGIPSAKKNVACMVLRVGDVNKATATLKDKGVRLIAQEELAGFGNM